MKKVLFLFSAFVVILRISSAFAYTEADLFRDLKGCRTYEKKPKEINGIVTGGRGQIILNNQERNISIYGIPVTLSCQYPDLLIKCDGSINIPQCNGKSDEFVNIDKNELMSRLLDYRSERLLNKYKEEHGEISNEEEQKKRERAKSILNDHYEYVYPYVPTSDTPSKLTSQPSESISSNEPLSAGNILDTQTESGGKTDLSNQSVENKSGGSGATSAATPRGSTVSGNVEKSSFVGASNLGDDYGMGDCGSGNIFQQLACRAGIIGSGLKTVGYMIAGFGLIVFSFAAIFGKVKWPLFATIMFSCFLLSATVFVINMMTDKGDASWIGGIKGNGSDYYSDNVTNVPATDSGGVPDGESPNGE